MKMLKQRIQWIRRVSFLLVFLGFSFLSWSEDFKFVKHQHVDKDSSLKTSLISFRGDIRIEGILEGSVLQVGGKLIVTGQVTADIIAMGTDVILSENSNVDGDLLIIGGKLNRAESARIKGEYFFVKLGSKEVESTFLPLFWEARTITLLKFLKIILWLLIGLMIYAMIPGRLHSMSLYLRDGNLAKYAMTGILTLLVSVTLLLLFTLLSLFIIGIPFLALLLVAGAMLILVGRTMMMYSVGLYMLNLIKKSNPIFSICCGALVFGVVKFIPAVGSIALILIDLVGSGIVINYMLTLRKQR